MEVEGVLENGGTETNSQYRTVANRDVAPTSESDSTRENMGRSRAGLRGWEPEYGNSGS